MIETLEIVRVEQNSKKHFSGNYVPKATFEPPQFPTKNKEEQERKLTSASRSLYTLIIIKF